MKLKTFYKIYYRHRINKANKLLKIYLFLIIPLKYLVNLPFIKKKINLDNYSHDKKFLFEKNLNFLFEFFESDKGEKFINQYNQPIKRNHNLKIQGHNYAKFYDEYFFDKKDKKLNILEIGSFYGNAAAALYFYFKNARIYSADIFPDLFSYTSRRIKNFYVDSSSEKSIYENILNKEKKFEIIIEDACHAYKDQIISLFMLFPILNSGGIFIVEELDFPDTRADMNLYNQKPTLRDILLLIKSGKNFENSLISKDQKDYFLKNFDKIFILKGNYNEIAIIKKK
jgi:predicted O-methyltransferase YrrM